MLTFTTLASGSSGNAALVSCGDTHILLDAGISARRIAQGLRALGTGPEALSAVLITHEHADHVAGLQVLVKKLPLPVYTTPLTGCRLRKKCAGLEQLLWEQPAGTGVQIGSMWVEPFSTPHDAADSVGYVISDGESRLAVCTDLGHVTDRVSRAVEGCGLLVCEANHDEDWVRTGPYPYYLKQRILGDFGHLSNRAGAELAGRAVQSGTRAILLAHLSQQNNTPARAYETAAAHLRAEGIDPERELTLSVAPRSELGPTFRLERGSTVRAFREREAALC